jgi:putative endopeptidase
VPLCLFAAGFAAWAQSSRAASSSPAHFDAKAMDKTANPCQDFYQYACGNWLKANPIPADQSRWGRFDELDERNKMVLRQILEEAAKPAPNRDATTQKIGDYYAACMDEKALDARGLKLLQPELDRIAKVANQVQLSEAIAHLHRIGSAPLFSFSSGQDFKDSTAVIAQLDQGGLGLPDRDYYLKDDPKSVELRQKYAAHVARMFELAGEKPEIAKVHAATVMKIETDLAKASLDRVSRRDPEKIYHPMKEGELAHIGGWFQWTAYFTGTGAPQFQNVNVSWPDYFKAVGAEIQSVSLEDWKPYLTWNLLHAEAAFLPTAFAKETFDFFGKTLSGAEEMRPRWKRCSDFTDADLGEALGRKFVERTFGAEGKERTLKMVGALEKALGEDIEKLPWMTPATKKQALVKLKAITNKIGYPDHWRDYSALAINPDDPLGNNLRASAFEFQRQLDKIGKPPDRLEWGMTPPTVNAYYDPQMNNINFPAGILQPPFYDNNADDAVNFGGIGMVIGHELTHGFDDQGAKIDAKGNLRDWWTKDDKQKFEERTKCVADQYAQYVVVDDIHINSRLTLGEDVADLGGEILGYIAWQDATKGKDLKPVDGLTPEQRFFIGFAQWDCSNQRPEEMRLRALTDPHSPSQYRINGVVVNMPDFANAFSCKAGQPMVNRPEKVCKVW